MTDATKLADKAFAEYFEVNGYSYSDDAKRNARAWYRLGYVAALRSREGMVLVPHNSTRAMNIAALDKMKRLEPEHGFTSHNEKQIRRAWHAMLAAAQEAK